MITIIDIFTYLLLPDISLSLHFHFIDYFSHRHCRQISFSDWPYYIQIRPKY